MDKRSVVARISRALKFDKNLPPIHVDSIAQQVERRASILKVRVQIWLESIFFSWLRQGQIIMKSFCSYISEDNSETVLWRSLQFVSSVCWCNQRLLASCRQGKAICLTFAVVDYFRTQVYVRHRLSQEWVWRTATLIFEVCNLLQLAKRNLSDAVFSFG